MRTFLISNSFLRTAQFNSFFKRGFHQYHLNRIEKKSNKILNIFDFDGTIFHSPTPNAHLWDKQFFAELLNSTEKGGYGWFENVLTLSPPFVPFPPPVAMFNASVVAEITESHRNPTAITVFLTGRKEYFGTIIKNILSSQNLHFQHYGFKPSDQRELQTIDFKTDYIKKLIQKYDPSFVQIWEDREYHVHLFRNHFLNFGRNYKIMYVKNNNEKHHLSNKLERELVQSLVLNKQQFASGQEFDQKEVMHL